MFKRKIFTGNTGSRETIKTHLYAKSETTYDNFKSACDNICNNILELLNECGVENCKYDDEHGWLYILGIPMTMYCVRDGRLCVSPPKDSQNLILQQGLLPNSDNTEYTISVTFVGDPQSAFDIVFTANGINFSQYQGGGYTIEFFHLTEQMEPNKVIGVTSASRSEVAIYKINPDGSAEEENEVIPYFDYTNADIQYLPCTAYGNSRSDKITNLYSQEKLLLVPWYTDSYLFRVDNCYVWNSVFNSIPKDNSGYNPLNPLVMTIDGKEYMLYNKDIPFLLELTRS